MKLKRTYDKKEEIPQGFESLYEEKDGKFVLKVEFEGLVGKEKVDEFRNTNTKLMQDIEALKKQYGDITPEKLKEIQEAAKKAQDEARKKEEQLALKEGNFEKLLETRTQEMRANYEKQIAELKGTAEKSQQELSRFIIERGIAEAAAKKKVLPSAIEDVLFRGSRIFTVKDGKPVALDEKGEPRYGKDGSVLTFETWLDQLAPSAPHLFEASSGSGASGKGGGATGSQTNPWKKETFNLTEQGRIVKTAPEQARRLAKEAGVPAPC